MSKRYAFELKGLTKTYKDFKLYVEELSLERGFVLGLVGPNGAGKSTIIKMMLNLIYPDSGHISVLGLDQPENEREIKCRVGYVSEDPSFYGEMTVGWTSKLTSNYYPNWDDTLYRRLIDKFQLDPRKRVKDLSKGMRVKLALALALSHNPELLIMDEPTSGLDPVIRRELLEEIVAIIADDRRSVIFSSHITQDVERVADFVSIIKDGTIVECADKENLLDRWKKVSGAMKPGHDELQSLFVSVKTDGNEFVGVTDSFSRKWLDELSSRGFTNLRTFNMNLDEILITLVGKEL